MGIGLVGCHQYSTLLIGIILFFMCVLRVTLWCILTIMGQFSEYKTLASLFLRFLLKICLGSWDRDNFLVICNFFIFQKKWIFKKNFIKNWLKMVKNQFSTFDIFQKMKDWIWNYQKWNWILWNYQKLNFQFFSLSEKLKIELKINFHFSEIIENRTKMKWTFLYTDGIKDWIWNYQKLNWILWNH